MKFSKDSTSDELFELLCRSVDQKFRDAPGHIDIEADREARARKIRILQEARRKFDPSYKPRPPLPPAKTDEERIQRIQEARARLRRWAEEDEQERLRIAQRSLEETSTPEPTEHPAPSVDAQMKAQAANKPQVVRRKPAPGSGCLDDYKSHSLDEQFAEARRLNEMAAEGNFDF